MPKAALQIPGTHCALNGMAVPAGMGLGCTRGDPSDGRRQAAPKLLQSTFQAGLLQGSVTLYSPKHPQGSLQGKVKIMSSYKIIKVSFPREKLLCVHFSDAYWASCPPALGTFPPLSPSPSILPFSCCTHCKRH